jgi:hypothetical protein
MTDALIPCQIVSMAGLALCSIHAARSSTLEDLKEIIASVAFLPRKGWHLVLGADMLTDPLSTPLLAAQVGQTLSIVHVDANIGHAKQVTLRLLSSSKHVRREALGELAILEEAATVAVPILVDLLQDEDAVVSALAVQVLSGLETVAQAKALAVPQRLRLLLEKTNAVISSELVYDDFMDLPESECMDTEDDWSSRVELRDVAMAALKQFS